MRYEVAYKTDQNLPIAGFSFRHGLEIFLPAYDPRASNDLAIFVKTEEDKVSADSSGVLMRWPVIVR